MFVNIYINFIFYQQHVLSFFYGSDFKVEGVFVTYFGF